MSAEELSIEAFAFFVGARRRVVDGTAHDDATAWVTATALHSGVDDDDELLGVALQPILADPDYRHRVFADLLVLGDLASRAVRALADELDVEPVEVLERITLSSPYRR